MMGEFSQENMAVHLVGPDVALLRRQAAGDEQLPEGLRDGAAAVTDANTLHKPTVNIYSSFKLLFQPDPDYCCFHLKFL